MDGWRAYHLHYHGDLDRVLLGFVRPAVASLLASGAIERFFFVRYALGGPHVRLRLRPLPTADALGETAATISRSAAEFLAREPSTDPLPVETVWRRSLRIAALDPGAGPVEVHPDNTLVAAAFEPEVDRYGGPGLLALSLDLFTVSSVTALDHLAVHGEARREVRLGVATRLLLRWALALARNGAEFHQLLGWGVDGWGRGLAAVVGFADRVFERASQRFRALVAGEIGTLLLPEATSRPSPPPGERASARWEHAAGRRFAAAVAALPAGRRRDLGRSHLHMTANRLGLQNTDEVYLSRLLTRAAEGFERGEPGKWEILSAALASSSGAGADLGEAVTTAMAALDDRAAPATADAAWHGRPSGTATMGR